jgi:hypothetical protein
MHFAMIPERPWVLVERLVSVLISALALTSSESEWKSSFFGLVTVGQAVILHYHHSFLRRMSVFAFAVMVAAWQDSTRMRRHTCSTFLWNMKYVPPSDMAATAWLRRLRKRAFSCSSSSLRWRACINFALVSLVALSSAIRLSSWSM